MSAGSFARRLALVAAMATAAGIANAACSATLYLTFDTGNMRHAELIAETLAKQGLTASGGTPERLRDLIAAELAKWAQVVKDAGIAAQ